MAFDPTSHYQHCYQAVIAMEAMAACPTNLLVSNTGYWDMLKSHLKSVGEGATQAASEIAAAGHAKDYNVAYYSLLMLAQELLNAELDDLATKVELATAESSFEFCWRICNTLRDPFNLGVFSAIPKVSRPAAAPVLQAAGPSTGTTRLLDAVSGKLGRPVTLEELQSGSPAPATR